MKQGRQPFFIADVRARFHAESKAPDQPTAGARGRRYDAQRLIDPRTFQSNTYRIPKRIDKSPFASRPPPGWEECASQEFDQGSLKRRHQVALVDPRRTAA